MAISYNGGMLRHYCSHPVFPRSPQLAAYCTSLTMSTVSPNPVGTTTLDAQRYPHILTRILHLSPRTTLLALRGTSRTMRERADAILGYHMIQHFTPMTHDEAQDPSASGCTRRTPVLKPTPTRLSSTTVTSGVRALSKRLQTTSFPPCGGPRPCV